MTESIITLLVAFLLIAGTVVPYYRRTRKRESEAHSRLEELHLNGLDKASGMHPQIDALLCIGCGSCVDACPEGDVLGVVNGRAVLVHGAKCVGHGRCADSCPVGAIRLVMAPPGRSANLPLLSQELETTMPGIFIAGELGGLGLIRNAVTQGTAVIRTIAGRTRPASGEGLDVIIVGAGPAGLAAALAAHEAGLRYLVLEQETIGGAILHYPRRKIVLTSPLELPLWGTVKITEVSKEDLLRLWERILADVQLNIRTGEKVIGVVPSGRGFSVKTAVDSYPATFIVLTMGRRGTPRKLGVAGEELSKVMYRLEDADSYADSDVLVVGGGDSAVEAALALSRKMKNRVTMSYRQRSFSRIKERNRKLLDEALRRHQLQILYGSTVREILPDVVLLEAGETVRTLRNDAVFILAGGEMPFEFLRSVGIGFHTQKL